MHDGIASTNYLTWTVLMYGIYTNSCYLLAHYHIMMYVLSYIQVHIYIYMHTSIPTYTYLYLGYMYIGT